MIMDLLAPSLVLLCEHGNGKFSLKAGLRMAYRLLGQLQAMHWLACCIATSRWTTSGWLGGSKVRLHIVDVDLCHVYLDVEGKHLAYRKREQGQGSAYYTSVDPHRGVISTRRDELESLADMVLGVPPGWPVLRGVGARPHSARRGASPTLCWNEASEPLEELCAVMPRELAAWRREPLSQRSRACSVANGTKGLVRARGSSAMRCFRDLACRGSGRRKGV
jgi:hypothetical protein